MVSVGNDPDVIVIKRRDRYVLERIHRRRIL
jgi:hypothetical protein